jgi:hypothetical protein
MIQNINFQYYPAEITKCKPLGFISLVQFLKATKNPKEKTKQLFEKIQQAEQIGDAKTKAELKCKLYKFTPCVHIYKWRSLKNITQFTGLLVLDFDHLEKNEAIKFKQVLFDSCSFIIACWLSPSKHGIKALVKIPICQTGDEFKSYFLAIENELGTLKGFDKTAKNCVQDLFLSYDADLLQRENATTWTNQYFEPKKEMVHIPIQTTDKTDVIVNIVVKKINEITITGHFILRAVSFALGGYVGAGYITESDAIYLIERCIDANAYLSKKASIYKKTAFTMIKNGITQPLLLENNIINIDYKKEIIPNVIQHKKIEVVNVNPPPQLLKTKFNLKDYEQSIDIVKRIRQNRNKIKDYENRISRIRTECKSLENTFIQASKSVKWEWIAPNYIGEPQGKNRLLELIYWTS